MNEAQIAIINNKITEYEQEKISTVSRNEAIIINKSELDTEISNNMVRFIELDNIINNLKENLNAN